MLYGGRVIYPHVGCVLQDLTLFLDQVSADLHHLGRISTYVGQMTPRRAQQVDIKARVIKLHVIQLLLAIIVALVLLWP